MKPINACLIVFAATSCLAPPKADGPFDPSLIATSPYVYQERFVTGEVNGWDSYPPAQDTAFDPTFGCVRHETDYALQKAVRPNRKGPLELGFIKVLSFIAEPETTLSFTGFIKTSSPWRLTVRLCAADGRLLSVPLSSSSGKVTARDFGITAPAEIQAVIFLATLTDADPDLTHRFLLDDIELRALRPARVRVLSPESRTYPDWDVTLLTRHYRPGDELRVDARQEGIGNLAASIVAPDGSLRALSGIYRFKKDDPPGMWKIRFTGEDRAGRKFESPVHFLLLKPDLVPHPRVLFTPERGEQLRAAARGEKKELWLKIKQQAEGWRRDFTIPSAVEITHLDSNHLLPTFNAYAGLLRRTSEFVAIQALVYFMDGDHEAGKAAKKVLLAMCGWDTWAHPWITAHGQHTYWPVGIASSELAIGYDLLYPLLTEDERGLLRKALLEKAIIPAYKEFVLADRIPFNTSNWIGIILGGSVASLMAIYAESDVEPYLSGMLFKLDRHLRATFKDGGYGEGIGYQCFDLMFLSPGLSALENTLEIDLATPHALDRTSDIIRYSLISPGKGFIAFGDSRSNSLDMDHPALAWLSHRFPRNRDLARLYRSFAERTGDHLHFLRRAFLYPGEPGLVEIPSKPPSRSFPDLAVSFLRSGWNEDARVMAFKCGPFTNHHHLDQGSFQLWAFGEEFLTEAGVTDYYADPHYPTFFTQPAGHNTLLVDGNPESQRVGDFQSEVRALRSHASVADSWFTFMVDHVRGRVHPVYRDSLKRFDRSMYFIKPDYFVLLDAVETSDQPRRLDWLFHVPSIDQIKSGTGGFSIQRSRGRLEIGLSADISFTSDVESSPVPINGDKTVRRGFVRVRSQSEITRATLLAMMVPVPAGLRQDMEYEELKGRELVGFSVKTNSYHDRFWAKTSDSSGTRDMGTLSTDASALLIRTDRAGKIQRLMIQYARECQPIEHGQFFTERILSSERPISAAVEYAEKSMVIEYLAEAPHRFAIGVPYPPRKVRVDGAGAELPYHSGRGEVDVRAEAGSHRIEISF